MSDLFIALLNPAIALIIAAAFLLLFMHQRHRRHLAVLAAGYSASAIGFLLQHFTLPIGFGPSRLVSVAAFLLSVALVAAAVVDRFRGRAPVAGLTGFALAGLGSVSWFMFVEPDITCRVLAANFAMGAMTLLVAAELRAPAASQPVERMLFVLALLAGLNFVLRPLVTVTLNGPAPTWEGFHDSLYWRTAILSHALLSLVTALTLLTSAVLDIIRDLRAETRTDPLSGLLNRRGFEARAGEVLEIGARSGLPVSLIIADLDRFKSLNDRFGHAAGDRVIVAFADSLKSGAGACGIVGRLGGDEFALLLPMSDLAAARQAAETLRAGFSARCLDGLPPDMRASASFGIAARLGEEDFSELFARADEALYRAKKGGRNGVRSSDQHPAEAAAAATALLLA